MLNRSTQRSAANYFAMSMLFKFSMTWDSLELWDNWAGIILPFRISYKLPTRGFLENGDENENVVSLLMTQMWMTMPFPLLPPFRHDNNGALHVVQYNRIIESDQCPIDI